MSDEKLSSDQQLAMASLNSRCEACGVASLKFNDGEMFMMSKTFIEGLLDRVTESKTDRIIIFIKPGGILEAD